MPRGMLGLGLLQEAETLGKRCPTQRRRHYHPQLLVLVTGPRNYQVAGKLPFLCQICVISLMEIVPSEEKAMTTHYSVLNWRIPGMGSLVGYCLWGCTELDTTEAT